MKKKNTKTLKEIAKELKIAEGTIYNWKKEKEKLYQIVIKHYSKTSIIEEYDELKEYYIKLTENEKKYYLSEIKTRILKKEIDN